MDAAAAVYSGRGLGVWNSAISASALYDYYAGTDAGGTQTSGFTWYIHSGNTTGGRNGTASAPYNSIAEWHTATNGGGTSTSGIVGNCTLVLCSGEHQNRLGGKERGEVVFVHGVWLGLFSRRRSAPSHGRPRCAPGGS